VIFVATPLAGAHEIEIERMTDERGFFARSFCTEEFAAHGLETAIEQCNVSWNAARGTLRGLHYQAEPHGEAKVVRCTQGAIHDVIVDLRPASPTFKRWHAVELSADNRRMLYIPRGFAHGFLTLTDGAEVLYQMSTRYAPSAARGVRYDDPAFGIVWPSAPRVVAPRDRAYPDFAA
jgi:dTDP-4-dehydrorhamnose 3,5-epimerase